jgi:pentatricopeptide repeat protein
MFKLIKSRLNIKKNLFNVIEIKDIDELKNIKDKSLNVYNSIIHSYILNNNITKGEQTLNEMKDKNIKPDMKTFNLFLNYYLKKKGKK